MIANNSGISRRVWYNLRTISDNFESFYVRGARRKFFAVLKKRILHVNSDKDGSAWYLATDFFIAFAS